MRNCRRHWCCTTRHRHRASIRIASPDSLNDFKDHFSGHAGAYAQHRPGYPDELFRYLADLCSNQRIAWDCATGSGQAAAGVSGYFDHVIATDASADQVANAHPRPGVEYRVVPAEASQLAGHSIDLITVAQGLHWFDIDKFFTEALRVLATGGVLAAWCYERCSVQADVDAAIAAVFAEVEDFWPPERRIVDNAYRDITLPMPEIAAPQFFMHANWSAAQILDYCRTWSASQRYLLRRGRDPVENHVDRLTGLWGSGTREVSWPITLRVGKKRH